MDVDPIRRFIWDVGNGTSEASLCATLETFFHTLCPLANLFDQEICKDYKVAYEARCSPSAHRLAQEGTFLYIAIVLIFCLAMASLLKAKKFLYLPDSGVTILVGVATGTLFVVSSANHRFNEQVFFEILLPFIIFEAGYNMDKTLLNQNFYMVCALAVVGTFISFAVTALVMKVGNGLLGGELSDLDCAMFGALISSTDPIAIVNVFSSLGVNPRLYSLVLGESALNDGVAVALYTSMKHFYSAPDIQGSDAVLYVLGNFLAVSLGSITLGFVFGISTAYFWKVKGRLWFVHPVLETLVFLVCAILPYYVADALRWSGVIAIVAGSMTLSIYAHGNLSSTARFHVVFVVECIARLCEAVMFGYLGTQMVVNNTHMVWNALVLVAFVAVLLGRALAVFPIVNVYNAILTRCGTQRPPPKPISATLRQGTTGGQVVPWREQVVIWFSGLRGALSFALAVTVPEYDTVLKQGSKHSGEILACTCFIIVVNVFLMGGVAPFVLRRMGVVENAIQSGDVAITTTTEEEEQEESSFNQFNPDRTGLVGRIHSGFLLPALSHQDQSQQTGRGDLSFMHSPFAPTPPSVPIHEPIPDENGFIHVIYDDEPLTSGAVVDDRERSHSFLFPRSRMALPRQRRQVSSEGARTPGGGLGSANSAAAAGPSPNVSPLVSTSLTEALLANDSNNDDDGGNVA